MKIALWIIQVLLAAAFAMAGAMKAYGRWKLAPIAPK
jgi:hypothetical protein